MAFQQVGQTTNFTVGYDDSLVNAQPAANQAQTQANLTANCNLLLGHVEAAFTTTTGWFGTDVTKFGTGNRQVVDLDLGDTQGANNTGYGHPINCDGQSQNNGATAGPIVSMLWMAEWSEILMSLTSNWDSGDSSGEGLSQFSAGTLFLAGHNDFYVGGFVQDWLNGGAAWSSNNQDFVSSPNAARTDWVTQTFKGVTTSAGDQIHGDGDLVSFGCALCFIYYMTVELGFTINEVIASYKGNLASCYHTVTGDPANPFPGFLGLLQAVFPASQTFSPATTNPDNPFPIALTQIWAQKNTFGKDEAQDIINTQGGLISEAFWVVVSGLSRQAFEALGVNVAPFSGSFVDLPGVTISANPVGAQFQNGASAKQPQLIRIPYDITLSSAFLGQFPATGVSPELTLTTSLTSGGQTVTGSSATGEFELIAAGDPYFTNIPPGGTNEPYLSQDLRVFGAAPHNDNVPFPGGPTFSDDSPKGAYKYITALLNYINGQTSFTNPAGVDPFSLLPDQSGEGQTDSSVAPFALSNTFPPIFANNYNFAIARVRMRGASGAAGEATDVRVFFRVFQSQSPDTDYDPNGTYLSDPDGAGEPGTPKPGAGDTTIPFFATGNAGSETDYGPGGQNIHTLTIPSGQDSLYWYYGCLLNFYDPTNVVDGNQVQVYFPGTHHCVVAQIAYDDAPIPTGVSPMSWDQLAQRNLQFTFVDNPGPTATHRAPQTFDIRPSKSIGTPGGTGLPPDALMIDWGDIPKGSTVSIYWPSVLASDVIALAQAWGGAAGLAWSDANTLTLKVESGVNYIPIPTGSGQNFAGLLTVELPLGIRAGQEFEVLVRRVAAVRDRRPPPPPPAPLPIQSPKARAGTLSKSARRHSPPQRLRDAVPAMAVQPAVEEPAMIWRYVVGAFLIRIPVSTSEQLLVPTGMTLAIMKWRLENLSPGNRWAPVLKRYIEYLSGLYNGVGGDAGSVPPSLTWQPPIQEGGGREHAHELCGKVGEVFFDCHGAFEGFVLDDCCGHRTIRSRDRGLGELVLLACQKNLTLCVRLCARSERVEGVTIRP
jgi:hypothetical protein